jgi:hypothetical protein
LLVTRLLVDGSAQLKNLTRLMPASLHYWTVRRMVNAGYWNSYSQKYLHDAPFLFLHSL